MEIRLFFCQIPLNFVKFLEAVWTLLGMGHINRLLALEKIEIEENVGTIGIYGDWLVYCVFGIMTATGATG